MGEPEDENGEGFGSPIGFPTDRRPCDARRAIDESTPKVDVAAWFAFSKLRVGSQLRGREGGSFAISLYVEMLLPG